MPKHRFVPVHLRKCKDHPDLKMISTPYPDINLLIIKCPNRLCDQPSAEIVENYRYNRGGRAYNNQEVA